MSDKVLITGPSLAPAAVKLLEDAGLTPVYVPPYSSGDGLLDAVREADPVGIISRMGRIDAAVLDAAPSLRVISKHGVGVDNIDTAEAARRGIPVLVATGANAVSVAEHAIALMFALARQLPEADASTQAGKWEKNRFMGVEVTGKTLGLIGAGNIGSIVADRALAAA